MTRAPPSAAAAGTAMPSPEQDADEGERDEADDEECLREVHVKLRSGGCLVARYTRHAGRAAGMARTSACTLGRSDMAL